MDAFKHRSKIHELTISEAAAVDERWPQFAILNGGLGIYWITHKMLSRDLLRNRPFIPQFFAVIPAVAFIYVGGLMVRFQTLKREGLLVNS